MKRHITACILAVALAFFAQAATAQLASSSWPKFHRDYASSGLGLYGGTGSDLSWTLAAGGAIRSAPVVGSDGTVYFTCGDGRIYAVSGSGTKLWDVGYNCVSTASPAIASDGTIYFGSNDNFLYALRSDGSLKWKKVLASRADTSISVGRDGTVYVGCTGGTMYAFRADGTQRWAYAAGAAISSSPAVGSDGSIYFGCQNGKVIALNSTGTLKWAFTPAGSGAFYASPALGSDGTVYIGSAGGFFYAINTNGTQKWRAVSGGDVRSCAAIYTNGNIYYGCRDGRVHALTSLGQALWTFATGGYVDSSPALGMDGGIFVGSLSGKLFAINPDGTERWRFDAGAAIYSSPAIGPAGALFIGSDNGNLYAFAADSTPPGAPTVTDDGLYQAASDRIHGAWSAVDAESGIFSYDYCIGTAPGLADVAPWLNVGGVSQHTRTGLVLADKSTYFITVRAINGAGLAGPEASSDGITIDATPPVRPTVTDDGAYISDATQLHASWSSADPECGVGKYEYSIGTTPGGVNIINWIDAGLNTSVVRTGLALQQGVTYYINVRATNGLGLVSQVGSSDGITVDTAAPPAPVVTDDGSFTASLTSLHATWQPVTAASGIASYEYSIGIAEGGTTVRDWTDIGLQTSVTATGLTLANGTAYYINVRARNSVGKAGAVGSSDGIIVDTTPPSRPIVNDEGEFTSSAHLLSANWFSTDTESDIAEYLYAVGTTSGGTDIRAWTSVGTQTSFVITSLPMQDGGKYYISVKSRNGAGAESAVGTSDGISVDLTPPSTPTVTDDGAFTTDGTQLHAVWSASDPQSGIARYEYCLGTSAGANDVRDWTSAGTSTNFTVSGLTLQSGLKYYISARAVNKAGATGSIGYSDGIFVESTPPTTPIVTDDGAYTRSTTTLKAQWSSEDPETGVVGFKYSIGTSPGAADLVPWTDVALATNIERNDLTLQQGGTYYINVRATNGVGLVSEVGSSDGITVDNTAPDAPTVDDDGDFTADNAQLHVTLLANDAESGIAYYECAVGTTPGGTDIVDWTNVGPGPDGIISGLTLTDGTKYYVTARATNGAGITGPVGDSNGIIVDTTGPVDVQVWDDGAYTGFETTLHVRWSASDPESGIRGYRYCIGTAPGLNDVADWLEVDNATEHTREGLTLTSGVIYYITVIAINNAGGESAPVSSDGITLDLTLPTLPLVTDNGQYWGYKTRMGASWTSDDPESGIVSYRMSIGTAPGAGDVADWLDVGNVASYERTSLQLQDGVTYYINVQAKNGAGRWSDTGSSDGILLDTTPPTTPVVTDDGDGTLLLDRLHCKWHSEDPESGIAEYVYCIGTSPGAVDMVGWTNAGTSEDVTVTGLNIEPMLTYYFAVKSRSKAGAWSAVSASDGISYSTGAAIWWRFRNDMSNHGRGLFIGTTVTDTAWTIPTQGYVESSPAIASDGTTYIGSADGKLYAITQNGTVRWTYNTGSIIDSSPAVADDGRILIGCNDGKLYCLNPAGELVWTYSTGGPLRSSPLIRNGVVYVGSLDYSLHAVDLNTGVKAWSHATGGEIWSSPACDSDGVIYFAGGDSYVYAIRPDGIRKWQFLTGSATDASPAVGADGTVYVGSGDAYFYAINPDGTQKWRYDAGTPVDSSSAIGLDGNIYFGAGFDGGNGKLVSLRPDGTMAWSVDLPMGGVVSSPAIDSTGKIYVGSCDEKMYCFNPDGTTLWSFKTGSSVACSPALGADSSVVFGSYDGNVYCLRDIKARDLTPPTTPIVTVPSLVLGSGEPVKASWTASDPDTMIAEYVYAIGTEPGLVDICYWTSAGIETSVTRDDLSPQVGQTYYVSVKARNPSQRWSEVGVSQGITVVGGSTVTTIGETKNLADTASVTLNGKIVGAAFPDCFFIQESSRSAGIKCAAPASLLSAGDVVNVTGTVATVNDVKALTNVTFSKIGTGPQPSPLGLCGRVFHGMKPDPFGINVKIWGKVTSAGTDFCVIDYRYGPQPAGGSGSVEIRSAGISAAPGDMITATGILSREPSGDKIVTVLRVAPGGSVAIIK
ncbi:MAG: PQQ-binding-like beta-propeller repeat protein [Armatimonadetes bacterium]|nr:PQQ-binding-like beta-propeller repeat protein [Armatimonadota bacterium]